jgi:integrin alpha FG-GAP repeat containing protein 1
MPCTSPSPHSNAILDLNGDCLADIFLTCATNPPSFEIWTNNKSKGFSLQSQGSLPPNTGQVTFADMNRDGTLDMVYPTCSTISKDTGIGTGCKINIIYNQQIPLCVVTSSSPSDKSCRKPDELCSVDNRFIFDFVDDDPNVSCRLSVRSIADKNLFSRGWCSHLKTFSHRSNPRGFYYSTTLSLLPYRKR